MTTPSPDTAAAGITFGIEIETMIPVGTLPVGGYHAGRPVILASVRGLTYAAPQFNGATWRADRDGSIRADAGYEACEFVSPVLQGEAGLTNLVQFLTFLKTIGAKTNLSCGLHITVGLVSVTGTRDAQKLTEFCRQLARHGIEHEWAIYAQTGVGRHANPYSHRLNAAHDACLAEAVETTDALTRVERLHQAGRGMINFRKAVGQNPVVEFRAFTGTINETKVLHHVATVLGLCRKAVATNRTPSLKLDARVANVDAPTALRRMHKLLRWVPGRQTTRKPVTEPSFGLFGILFERRTEIMARGMASAVRFEQQFPRALTHLDAAGLARFAR